MVDNTMKEIKFRAWDKKLKQMRGVFNLVDMYVWRNWGLDSANEFFEVVKRTIFLQYTGLKDKNGVEIFEGDIVNLHCSSNPKHILKAEVFCYKNGFTQRIIQKKGVEHSWCGMHDCFDYMEVIGNIYENEELIV